MVQGQSLSTAQIIKASPYPLDLDTVDATFRLRDNDILIYYRHYQKSNTSVVGHIIILDQSNKNNHMNVFFPFFSTPDMSRRIYYAPNDYLEFAIDFNTKGPTNSGTASWSMIRIDSSNSNLASSTVWRILVYELYYKN